MFDVKKAESALAEFRRLLEETPPGAPHVRVAPDAWTLAEIVGHLIDSAGNNHQRFVRLRFGDLAGFPAYEAEPWVQAQGCDGCDFASLTALWTHFNELLLHLARTAPEAALANAWAASGETLTLDFLQNDYYAHLRVHAEHYRLRLDEVRRTMA